MEIKLKAKKNCKYCFGKGYKVMMQSQYQPVDKYRELVPCHCMSIIVEVDKDRKIIGEMK